MKVFFVLKPSHGPGQASGTVQKFYDVFHFEGRDIARHEYTNRKAGYIISFDAYPYIAREILEYGADWVVVHGRVNQDFVKYLHIQGFRNVVVYDQDEIFKPTHPRDIENNLKYAAINVQEHKSIVDLYPQFQWLPPFFERYMEPTCIEKKYDIGFLGFVNLYRAERLIKLFARVTDNWIIHDCVTQGTLRGEEAGNFYASCKIVAHIPRADEADNPLVNHATSSRMFQVLGVGSFYLMQANSGIEGLFRPGKHLQTFKTDRELVRRARHYLKWETNREKIAEAGRKLVYQEHLCYARAQQFWQLLEETPREHQSPTVPPLPPKLHRRPPRVPARRIPLGPGPPDRSKRIKRKKKNPPPSRRTDWQ